MAREYIKETNQTLGLYGFTIGMASIGKSHLYAWLALPFLLLLWYSRFSFYQKQLKALRAIGHEIMKPSTLLRHCIPALLGWLFLGAVAVELIKPV